MLLEPLLILQPLDNKDVRFATPNSEAGVSCNTCVYYHLPLPPEADIEKPYHDFTLDDLPNVIRVDTPVGVCNYDTPRNSILINVPANYCCYRYRMRPFKEQFEDNTITGDER